MNINATLQRFAEHNTEMDRRWKALAGVPQVSVAEATMPLQIRTSWRGKACWQTAHGPQNVEAYDAMETVLGPAIDATGRPVDLTTLPRTRFAGWMIDRDVSPYFTDDPADVLQYNPRRRGSWYLDWSDRELVLFPEHGGQGRTLAARLRFDERYDPDLAPQVECSGRPSRRRWLRRADPTEHRCGTLHLEIPSTGRLVNVPGCDGPLARQATVHPVTFLGYYPYRPYGSATLDGWSIRKPTGSILTCTSTPA